ncbi:MAG TPA: protein translocase subunit SecF [Longimicrobiales bacterium]|nr:protein translocase subunit SecF [Longimicrobiales bacterium]
MRLFENASYDFLGQRRRAYVVSAVVLLIGIGSMLVAHVTTGSWVDYGVDFTGGALIQVRMHQSTEIDPVRQAVRTVAPGADVTRFEGQDEFLVRAPIFETEGEQVSDQIAGALSEAFGDDAFTIVRTEAVGPKVGAELQQRALLAILLSFGMTLIYLAFRFEWRFGVAAVIATVHDILIALGFLAVFRIEVSLPTVAAVLTIIGYSLNDTIVIFDRIRENLKKSGRRESYRDIVNHSINETLPRTVMTSSTTLAALFSLFLLGGGIIRPFALILIVGILVGTYSSIFVASPALLEIERRWKRKDHPGRAKPARARAGV